MSTLSGIISSGSGTPIGQLVFLPTEIANSNFTVNNQEYLKSGRFKDYSATYAPLINLGKWYGAGNVNTVPSLVFAAYVAWGKLEYSSNANNFYILSGSTSYAYSPNLSSVAGTFASSAFPASAVDSISFKGVVCVGVPVSTGSRIFIANGIFNGAVSNTLQNPGIGPTFAASEPILFAANTLGGGNTAYAIGQSSLTYRSNTTTGNLWGGAFTITTPPTATIARFGWSNPGTCLVAVNTTGAIFTSADSGDNWTQRTTPTNLIVPPSSGTGSYPFQSKYCATSNTVALISLNGGQLLRSTNGTTWTCIDLFSTLGIPYGIERYFAEAANIIFDGTKFALFPCGTARIYDGHVFTSTDGLTWSPGWKLYNSTGYNANSFIRQIDNYGYSRSNTANGAYLSGVSFVNNNVYMLSSASGLGMSTTVLSPYNITNKYDSATPEIIGVAQHPGSGTVSNSVTGTITIGNGEAGTSLTAYLRIA